MLLENSRAHIQHKSPKFNHFFVIIKALTSSSRVVTVIPPTILIPVVIGAAAELLASELPAQELMVAGDGANHFSGYQFSVKVNVKKAIA
jgi:hypothetical protein